MFSLSRDLLDCRQLYIKTNHFCNSADEIAVQSLIGHDRACSYRISPYTKYLYVALYLLNKKLVK
jgi:hypothetical protein